MAPEHRQGWVKIGSMNEVVRRLLVERGVRMEPVAPSSSQEEGWSTYTKWVMSSNFCRGRWDHKAGDIQLPQAGQKLRWDTVRPEDIGLVKSRVDLPFPE